MLTQNRRIAERVRSGRVARGRGRAKRPADAASQSCSENDAAPTPASSTDLMARLCAPSSGDSEEGNDMREADDLVAIQPGVQRMVGFENTVGRKAQEIFAKP